MSKKYILNVTPFTWVRVTANDSIFFKIPEDRLYPSGLKRKRRLEKYNEQKITLSAEAKRVQFVIPPHGAHIKFFIPMPKTWRQWKRDAMHFYLHQSRPDLKNLLSAFEDSLCQEDKYIANYSGLSKYWVDHPVGWIEITIDENIKMPLKEIPTSLKQMSY